jgi:hypothetical protein
MKNTIFTIVAKNYLPLAKALEVSIRKHHAINVEFYIFVVGSFEDLNELSSKNVIFINQIGLNNLQDLAFKYNVTEFCTAIKPLCFKYMFNKIQAEKVIYFDPDIFVFNNLSTIFDALDLYDAIVTPHYLTPEINYTGDQEESKTLFVGIFNFGFVAIKNTAKSNFLMEWWNQRLMNQCYGDKQDSLHTDQRWGDFFPTYFGNSLLISKHLGCNVAPWNLFEREIYRDNQIIKVRNRFTNDSDILLFVHFAGYDPNNLTMIHKRFWDLNINKYPEYNLVREPYTTITESLNFNTEKNSKYEYSYYTDGTYVQEYHRRIYRALVENGFTFDNPFCVNDSFYRLLKKHRLISKNKPIRHNIKSYAHLKRDRKIMNKLLKTLFVVIGVDKYFILMNFLNKYSRPENQTFLLNKHIEKIY